MDNPLFLIAWLCFHSVKFTTNFGWLKVLKIVVVKTELFDKKFFHRNFLHHRHFFSSAKKEPFVVMYPVIKCLCFSSSNKKGKKKAHQKRWNFFSAFFHHLFSFKGSNTTKTSNALKCSGRKLCPTIFSLFSVGFFFFLLYFAWKKLATFELIYYSSTPSTAVNRQIKYDGRHRDKPTDNFYELNYFS